MVSMDHQMQLSFQKVMQAFENGNFNEAESILDKILQADFNNAGAVFKLATSYANVNRLSEALASFNLLAVYQKDDARIYYNIGLIHSMQGDHQLALENYDLAIKINPDDVDILINKGSTCIDAKNYVLALQVLEYATQLRPDIAEAWSNKGIALNNLNLYQESLNAYNEAIRLNPGYHEAWSNKSAPLIKLNRIKESLEACEIALSIKPNYPDGWLNKGVSLHQIKKYEEAIACFDRALLYKPELYLALSNKGNSLDELNRFEDSIACYEQAISLNPNIDWIYGDLLHMKMKIFSIKNIKKEIEVIKAAILSNRKVIAPFELLSLVDDPFLQKRASEIFVKWSYPRNTSLGLIAKHAWKEKIHIAYFSADFKNHPVALLTAQLYEIHDRSQFEIYAFSLVKATDEMRNRLLGIFDHFIDVENQSDIEIARLARALDIDIAVDLTGFTQDSRTGIFAYRAAPIQVNWLGYPGTMGADYMDYIIADKTLIPPQAEQFYSEKVVYLPNSYQVNDRKRLISDRQFTRQELYLPEDGFVFCCFNNNFKVLPATFEGWMKILKEVDRGVLWLLQDNLDVVNNLKKEALLHGVEPNRLIFAERMPLAEHLARHRQANLFLDTLPYNAHTTTSDALWAGLPVLTLIGQSFPSRVAASLLNAIGLPELVTTTQKEYETLAIQLASDPSRLLAIKNKLADNRLSAPLFDTPLFAKNLEAAYLKMYERYQTDLEPEYLVIG
jgi:predicted O-linked N-acetylglucosamine transferase (SPINDLY family)